MVLLEEGVVAKPDARRQLLVVGAGRLQLVFTIDDLVLGARDQRNHPARRVSLLIEAHLVHDTLDYGEPVRFVVDDEMAVDSIGAPVTPQNANSHGMKRPPPDPPPRPVPEVLPPAAQLPGGP